MFLYFDYPLEQGLRRALTVGVPSWHLYFDYPLEQGLRHECNQVTLVETCILIIH